MEIVVEADDRERGSAAVRALTESGAVVRLVRLGIGDYRLASSVLVERKTAWDFVQSIFDGRLFRQASRLARAAPRPLLLVEGPGLDPDRPAIRGALLTVTAVFGLPVLFSKDADDTAKWLLAASKQLGARRENAYARPGWRPKGKRARQVFVLQDLPGVGPVKAERLLDRFGTVRAVLNAGEQELREVRGIGPAIARRIVWLAT